MAAGGIGSVSVNVVPDSTGFWRSFEASSRAQLAETGRTIGRDLMDSIRAETDRGINIRVNADTARARAEIAALGDSASKSMGDASKESHLLRDAIVALAPAAIPVAGVLGGALAGLIPTLATVALGVSGISGEMKSGALNGTKYGADIKSLQTELSTLKAVSSAGLLKGVDQALTTSGPLFKVVNTDVQEMSDQIGSIVAGAGPGLLSILTQLDPLFNTFGNTLADGAHRLETWATSTGGIQKFVVYVQQELPVVMDTFAQLITFVGRTSVAFAPLGGNALRALDLIATGLNAIPLPVLKGLETGALSAFLAFRTFSGISSIVRSVSGSFASLSTSVQAFRDKSNLASVEVEAGAAREAASVATAARTASIARLAEAQSAVSAAEEQVVAARSVGEAETAAAEQILAARTEEAASAQVAATAAIAASTEASAAAEAMATRVVAASETSAVGWTAALGPIGALAVGITLLSGSFFGQSHASQAATQANESYAESVKQSTDALNHANLSTTADNLSKDKSLSTLDQLHKSNAALGVSYGDLTQAVNGSASSYSSVIKQLQGVAAANQDYRASARAGRSLFNDTGQAAEKLIGNLKSLRGSLGDNIRTQIALNQAQNAATQLADGGSVATQRQAAALGVSKGAYLAAQQAAQQNTDQTKQQTAAFQLENDAASLLKNALDGLAGIHLAVAQAQTALASSNLQVKQSFKDNGDAIAGNTAKAVANQQAIQQQVSAAQQYAEAVAQSTHSSNAGVAAFKKSKDAIEAQLKAQGKLTPAVKDYINRLYDLSKLHVPPTKVDIAKDAAEAKVKVLQAKINAIRQNREPRLSANTAAGQAAISNLQAEIGALRQPYEPSIDVDTSAALAKINALAGAVSGLGATLAASQGSKPKPLSGTATGGGLPEGVSAVGERGAELAIKHGSNVQILSNSQSKTYLAATGLKAPGFASGTSKASQVANTAISNAQSAIGAAQPAIVQYNPMPLNTFLSAMTKAEKDFTKAVDAGVSGSKLAKLRHQLHDLVTTANKQLGSLKITIKGSDFNAFKTAATETADDVRTAFNQMAQDIRDAGRSTAIPQLQRQEQAIISLVNDRTSALAKLGSAATAPTAYDQLSTAKSNVSDEASTVNQALTGSFNISSAGTGPSGSDPVSLNSILAQALQAKDTGATFTTAIEQLSKKFGTTAGGQALVQQLSEAGPSSLSQVQALLGASSAQLTQLASNTNSLSKTGLGSFVGNDIYGSQVTAANKRITDLQTEIRGDNTKIATREATLQKDLVGALTGWRIQIDSRGLAKLVKEGTKRSRGRSK